MFAYTDYTDPELINLLGKDDQKAFDVLYARHWAGLYQSAFYLLKDRDACMDIVQDIFTWLWERRQKLEIKSVPSYLKAAVKFKVANYIRSGNIRESFFDDLAKLPANPKANPEELLEVNELRAIVFQAIENLPGKCKEIFNMSREDNMTNQQIADRLGISLKTVEAQMTIALKRIRTTMEPYLIAMLLAEGFYHFS